MSLPKISKIFIIGGTGAQGLPVIKSLVADKKYSVRVLTRDPNSARAKSLLALGNVELHEGTFADEEILRSGFQGCDGAFVNIDGFNTGEKSEIYWAIRAYEIALQSGIKFYVYGNLDYASKKTKTIMTPTVENGVVTWRLPMGTGSMLAVALEDCGVYVRWLFDNRERSNGMDLEIAIEDVKWAHFAKAFEEVTGHPAKYIDTSLEDYWKERETFGQMPAGYNAVPNDKSTMNVKDNFTGFWNVWKYSLLKRDYNILDEIHPTRIKTAEEWLRMEDKKGIEDGKGTLWDRIQGENLIPILKIGEDNWGETGKYDRELCDRGF
ncbi:putative NmrA-like family domain-containing protein 1 [Glarea lozoyensis 74030]|uniref:Putative NmrA-like family domain-containing protein 1 n=1 Tax=Glarea lozoyensis (strain ATCC 74030 / MF5533) TaxID=1104152 RepID=H0EUF3_GLAL7|nr:putative NmrA-like family domain-containing protein 1 [Glarea lozoyensis 74030]